MHISIKDLGKAELDKKILVAVKKCLYDEHPIYDGDYSALKNEQISLDKILEEMYPTDAIEVYTKRCHQNSTRYLIVNIIHKSLSYNFGGYMDDYIDLFIRKQFFQYFNKYHSNALRTFKKKVIKTLAALPKKHDDYKLFEYKCFLQCVLAACEFVSDSKPITKQKIKPIGDRGYGSTKIKSASTFCKTILDCDFIEKNTLSKLIVDEYLANYEINNSEFKGLKTYPKIKKHIDFKSKEKPEPYVVPEVVPEIKPKYVDTRKQIIMRQGGKRKSPKPNFRHGWIKVTGG